MAIVARLAGHVYGQGAKGVYDVGVGVFLLDGEGGGVSEGRGVPLEGRLDLEEVLCEERVGVAGELDMGGAEGVFELADAVGELGYFLMELLGGSEHETRTRSERARGTEEANRLPWPVVREPCEMGEPGKGRETRTQHLGRWRRSRA